MEPARSLANAVNTGLTLVDDTLASTNDALAKVDGALGTTATNVAAAQGTFQSLAATVNSTTPALGSLSKFLSDDLPGTLDAAQKTLSGAADSAKVVDGVLSLLSDLPLFNIDYNPEVSLSDSLGGIGGSLEGLPDTLGQLGKQLAGPANTLPALARSLDTLGTSISQLETTLTDFQGVVGSYQDLINRYRSMIQSLQAAMLRLVTIVPADGDILPVLAGHAPTACADQRLALVAWRQREARTGDGQCGSARRLAGGACQGRGSSGSDWPGRDQDDQRSRD